jgi:uncharacterized repeat protein (TIGR01451 family)
LSDSPDPAPVGGSLTYTATVMNHGPADASTVTLTDTLPAGMTFVAAPGCSVKKTAVTCALGTVANGASMVRTIEVQPTKAGSWTDTAKVTSKTADPNAANNRATVTTTVQ